MVFKSIRKNFTQVSNSLVQNDNLSVEARGAAAFMISLPESWDFNKKHLAEALNVSKSKLNRIIKELRNAKHLWLAIVRDELGRIKDKKWLMFNEPTTIEEASQESGAKEIEAWEVDTAEVIEDIISSSEEDEPSDEITPHKGPNDTPSDRVSSDTSRILSEEDREKAERIFDAWNEQGGKHEVPEGQKGWHSHDCMTDRMKKAIDQALQNHSEEDVIGAIVNYAQDLFSDESYFTHVWTLVQFLTSTDKETGEFKWHNYLPGKFSMGLHRKHGVARGNANNKVDVSKCTYFVKELVDIYKDFTGNDEYVPTEADLDHFRTCEKRARKFFARYYPHFKILDCAFSIEDCLNHHYIKKGKPVVPMFFASEITWTHLIPSYMKRAGSRRPWSDSPEGKESFMQWEKKRQEELTNAIKIRYESICGSTTNEKAGDRSPSDVDYLCAGKMLYNFHYHHGKKSIQKNNVDELVNDLFMCLETKLGKKDFDFQYLTATDTWVKDIPEFYDLVPKGNWANMLGNIRAECSRKIKN